MIKIKNNYEWNDITTPDRIKTFQWGEEPELIHVIKTGFIDKYMVVYEDAYELYTGIVDFYNKEDLEKQFKIKI